MSLRDFFANTANAAAGRMRQGADLLAEKSANAAASAQEASTRQAAAAAEAQKAVQPPAPPKPEVRSAPVKIVDPYVGDTAAQEYKSKVDAFNERANNRMVSKPPQVGPKEVSLAGNYETEARARPFNARAVAADAAVGNFEKNAAAFNARADARPAYVPPQRPNLSAAMDRGAGNTTSLRSNYVAPQPASAFGVEGSPPAAAPAAAPEMAAKKAGLLARGARGAASLAGTVAKYTGPLAAASGVPAALSDGTSNMDDRIARELTASDGALTGENSPIRAATASTINLARRTGNALSFGLDLGDKVVGGLRDVAQGNLLGTTRFGAPTGQPVTPPTAQAPSPAAAPPTDPIGARATLAAPTGLEAAQQIIYPNGRAGLGADAPATPALPQTWNSSAPIQTNQGLRSPASMIQRTNGGPQNTWDGPANSNVTGGNAVPARGYGAFQRTTPGNEGTAQSLGASQDRSAREQPVRPQRSVYGYAMAAMAGVPGRVANIKAAQSAEVGAAKERELGSKETANALAAGKLGFEIGEKNRERFNTRAKNLALKDPDLAKISDKDEHMRELGKRTAEITERAEYSMANYGVDPRTGVRVSMDNASPEHMNKFNLAERFRAGVLRGRGDKMQFLRNFFGSGRGDSENSFSYLPAYREGNKLTMHNGNTVSYNTATGSGDGFFGQHLFSPNSPDDRDMLLHMEKLQTKQEYMKAVEEARKKGGK